MNMLMRTEYPPYKISESQSIPLLLDVIYNKSSDEEYKSFKFYNKSSSEKKQYFNILQQFYSYSPFFKGYVLWLIDSPRMTHLAINEILELESKGYKNIIVMGKKNADINFFRKNSIEPITAELQQVIREYEIKYLFTPCLNRIHNKILDKLSICKIGIQHGYGTWVEANMLNHVDKHYNFGYISAQDFNPTISKTAGYSPTKTYSFFKPADEGYILYLSQGANFTNKQNVIYGGAELVKISKYFRMPLVIKTHASAGKEFDDVVEAKVYKEGEINTEELIRKAAIVITSWSGAGVESIFFKKPTVIIDTQNNNGKFFKNSGLVVEPIFETIKKRIKDILEGKQFLNQDFPIKINHKGGVEASKIITEDIQ